MCEAQRAALPVAVSTLPAPPDCPQAFRRRESGGILITQVDRTADGTQRRASNVALEHAEARNRSTDERRAASHVTEAARSDRCGRRAQAPHRRRLRNATSDVTVSAWGPSLHRAIMYWDVGECVFQIV